ncbi:hypothetical protein [Flavobacterium notoginsengisoli]|uniref:hypothetical protein n=1 Tax=Flavobacterium notoginsengisoli TaxID=1478199 RepID=UPI0036284BFA
MTNYDSAFRWMKVKNGRLHFASIELDIQKNDFENKIVDDYLVNGFKNDSEGIKPWKKGLIRGLEFTLSKSSNFWTIVIKELQAPVLDSNPAIIGYTAILAFIEKTKIIIDEDDLRKIELFVYESWKGSNADKVPNFNKLIFE